MELQEWAQWAQILAFVVSFLSLAISILAFTFRDGSNVSPVIIRFTKWLLPAWVREKLPGWIQKYVVKYAVLISAVIFSAGVGFILGVNAVSPADDTNSLTSTPVAGELITPDEIKTPFPSLTHSPEPTETPLPPSPTPIPTHTETPLPPSSTPIPTHTETPTPTVTLTSTEAPPTQSPTSTPTPTDVLSTPMPSPTENPIDGIVIKNSSMRAEAKESSAIIVTAYVNDLFTIIERSEDEEWVKINIANEKIGWVRTDNIRLNRPISSVMLSEPTLTPAAIPTFQISGNDKNISERSIIEILKSGQQHWYTFKTGHQRKDINITLLIKPITNRVTFAIYDERQYQLYKNEDINSIWAKEIGQINTRSDQDWVNWNGNLTSVSKFFLRVVNNHHAAIEYCLVPTDIETWDKCP